MRSADAATRALYVVPIARVLEYLRGLGNRTAESFQGAGEWTLR